MFKQLTLWATLALFSLATRPVNAQSKNDSQPEAQEKRYYHMEFTIKEVDAGKTINSRTYSVVAVTHQKTELRTGTRLPFRQAPGGVLDYLNLGVSIDCLDLTEVGNQLALRIIADIQTAVSPEDKSASDVPVIRQNKWDSGVIIPLNHPVTIFSSDDLNSKGKMQLEVMAAPINNR